MFQVYRDLLVEDRTDRHRDTSAPTASPMDFNSILVVEPTPCQGPFRDALPSSAQPLKPSYSLAIVIS